MHPTPPASATPARPGARAFWLVAGALALVALAAPAGADVYKWIDAQGRVHYSDRPPPPDGKLVSVEPTAGTAHGRAEPPPPVPAPTSTAASPNRPAQTPEELTKLKQTVDADVAKTHAGQCKEAQERYSNYVNSRKLYKEGPNKERVYLTDAELEAARLNARREIDETCADVPH